MLEKTDDDGVAMQVGAKRRRSNLQSVDSDGTEIAFDGKKIKSEELFDADEYGDTGWNKVIPGKRKNRGKKKSEKKSSVTSDVKATLRDIIRRVDASLKEEKQLEMKMERELKKALKQKEKEMKNLEKTEGEHPSKQKKLCRTHANGSHCKKKTKKKEIEESAVISQSNMVIIPKTVPLKPKTPLMQSAQKMMKSLPKYAWRIEGEDRLKTEIAKNSEAPQVVVNPTPRPVATSSSVSVLKATLERPVTAASTASSRVFTFPKQQNKYMVLNVAQKSMPATQSTVFKFVSSQKPAEKSQYFTLSPGQSYQRSTGNPVWISPQQPRYISLPMKVVKSATLAHPPTLRLETAVRPGDQSPSYSASKIRLPPLNLPAEPPRRSSSIFTPAQAAPRAVSVLKTNQYSPVYQASQGMRTPSAVFPGAFDATNQY